MANILKELQPTPEEEMELFESLNMLLVEFIDPTLDLNGYLRSVICATLGVPESTPDDQLQSNVHDMLPVYIERVRRDYGDRFDIDAFVRFIIDDLRNGG